MAVSIRKVIMLVISLVIMGMLMPIGLAYIGSAGTTYVMVNGVNTSVASVVDPTVISMLTIILPIVAVVGIIIYMIPMNQR